MINSLHELFKGRYKSDFSIIADGDKTIFSLGKSGEYGTMEVYSIFPGVFLSYIDIYMENTSDFFLENVVDNRILEINHCSKGRYAYSVGDDKVIYFGDGDLSISIYNLTKSVSNFPLGYYKGLELFIDVDVASDHVKKFVPNFDLVDFYENLEKNHGYVLVRSNEEIDHIIGELYDVDDRIKFTYFQLKTIELLLFFSIAKFQDVGYKSISINQVKIIDSVKNDLMDNLDSKITIDELACKYGIGKTTLKNCFKEIYGKPIIKWRKEYKLDVACRLIQEGNYNISEISRMIGYSSHSKFSKAFKDYVGCNPSDFKN